jgi:hypothetical protein
LPLPAFTTGPTGAYRLDDLPLGRWKLQMLALGFQVGLVDVVVSAPGETVDVPDVQLISSP